MQLSHVPPNVNLGVDMSKLQDLVKTYHKALNSRLDQETCDFLQMQVKYECQEVVKAIDYYFGPEGQKFNAEFRENMEKQLQHRHEQLSMMRGIGVNHTGVGDMADNVPTGSYL